jgi:[protein-PII] uridylyltransferase
MLNPLSTRQADPDAPAGAPAKGPGRTIGLARRAGVRKAKAIIDPALFAERLTLATQAAADGGDGARRTAMLEAARASLDAGRAEIRRRFLEDLGGGDACVAEGAYLVDVIVRGLADLVADTLYPAPNPTMGERFAILATGGYGRGEMAPFSDVDLLFLLPYKRTARVEQVVETLLYLLWDMGLKVGHAVRSVGECVRTAKADITIRTALLEARPLWGERDLVEELRRRFWKDVAGSSGPEFVEAKLAERDERHRKLGDSRYVLEPNIKDGKGGLRDLHTLFWIGKYLYRADNAAALVKAGVLTGEEAETFAHARSFLHTLRCHLHYLAGRAEERLTFDLQAEVGRRMGYTDHAGASGTERFMKHYFLIAKDVGNLTRIVCAALEAESQRKPLASAWRARLFGSGLRALDGFLVDGTRLTVSHDKQFREAPVDMIRLFHVAQENELQIHPHALKLITRALGLIGPRLRGDETANRLFLGILTSRKDPEHTLRRMNESGVLGKFIPDFGRVVAQMQYDMYHVYTVDEHTLFAIGMLSRIERGKLAEDYPLATRVAQKIEGRRALYVAVLCHDIAKGRGGDHSVLGAKVAAKLGPRLGLSEEETETAVWLVRWHLLMSSVAQKRDIDDEQTVRRFQERVESPERLRLLLVLTTVDISAVGPGRWTAWKATLLGQLFHRTKDRMLGGLDSEGREARIAAAKQAMAEHLPDWSAEEVERHAGLGYPSYWLSLDGESHARHARLVRQMRQEGLPLLVDTEIDAEHGFTVVTVLTADHPGLFSRLAGALAATGASVLEAKIFTLTDGTALDIFHVQDAATGEPFAQPDKLARLSVAIEQALSGELQPRREIAKRDTGLPARARVFHVAPRVVIDNEASRTHTIVEVNGRDRPGLLYDVTRALSALSLQIASAKISTFGERAVDVFYVKDLFGLKVTHEGKLDTIRDGLRAALVDPDAPAGQAQRQPPVRGPRRGRTAMTARERARVGQASTRGADRKADTGQGPGEGQGPGGA